MFNEIILTFITYTKREANNSLQPNRLVKYLLKKHD